MPITAEAPTGGTVEQLGGESRPLILRNGEIERFERQHGLGIFAMLDLLIGKSVVNGVDGNVVSLKSSHCRDIVALGLVGGGLADKTADKLVDDLPPYENHRIRAMAQDLIFAAFVPPEDGKKKAEDLAGSSKPTGQTDTKRKRKSKAQSAQD